jgi:uncharacterized flavoprotein (TIGR03862 family)
MKTVIIVGAGPTGLFVADQLLKSNSDVEVKLFDQMASAGNKLLVAGKSGLNLTHAKSNDEFSDNYFEDKKIFTKWLTQFNNEDLTDWVGELGIETFVGSSGRVFPVEFKAAYMLKLWMDRLKSHTNFKFYPKSNFTQITNSSVTINDEEISYSRLVLALGGGSWKKTGSDGKWTSILSDFGVSVKSFKSLNCGFNANISFEYMPVKYCDVSFDGNSIKGDLMFTPYGIEGSPVYYLSHFLIKKEKPVIKIDLCPDISLREVQHKIENKKSMSSKLKSFLSYEAIELIKATTTKEEFHSKEFMACAIKGLEIELLSPRDIDEVISTNGGVCMSEINDELQLKTNSNVYIGGEMLNWDAPTGGYLLQACFSQAYQIAKSILSN